MRPLTDPSSTRLRATALTALLCTAFVAVGGGVATLGPSLPGLARGLGRPLPDLGILLSALFAGMLQGQVAAGLLVDRMGVRRPMLASFLLFASGIVGLPLAPAYGWLLLSGLVMGTGFGMASISVNTMASRLLPSRPGFVLNLCNVWYAGGTVVGPFLASVLLDRGSRATVVLTLAGTLAALLVPVGLWLLPASQAPSAPDDDSADETDAAASGARRARPWRPSASLVFIGIVVTLYGGVEAGFGQWAASYVQQTLQTTAARGALLTSLFWLAYLLGRIAATLATLIVTPGQVLAATAVLVLLGGLVLGVGHADATLTTTAIAVLGFGIGPLYPAMFGLVTSRERARPGTAVSVASSIGSVGAIVFPWLMGQALPVADGRIVAWMPAALGAAMLAALWWSERLYRPPSPRA